MSRIKKLVRENYSFCLEKSGKSQEKVRENEFCKVVGTLSTATKHNGRAVLFAIAKLLVLRSHRGTVRTQESGFRDKRRLQTVVNDTVLNLP